MIQSVDTKDWFDVNGLLVNPALACLVHYTLVFCSLIDYVLVDLKIARFAYSTYTTGFSWISWSVPTPTLHKGIIRCSHSRSIFILRNQSVFLLCNNSLYASFSDQPHRPLYIKFDISLSVCSRIEVTASAYIGVYRTLSNILYICPETCTTLFCCPVGSLCMSPDRWLMILCRPEPPLSFCYQQNAYSNAMFQSKAVFYSSITRSEERYYLNNDS